MSTPWNQNDFPIEGHQLTGLRVPKSLESYHISSWNRTISPVRASFRSPEIPKKTSLKTQAIADVSAMLANA